MQKHSDDDDIDMMAMLGAIRCANDDSMDAAVLIPTPPYWTKNRKQLLAQQCKAMGGQEALLNQYVELLVRCQAMIDFIQENVGPDDDWPLAVLGESEEAEDCFTEIMEKVASSVGCLTEI